MLAIDHRQNLRKALGHEATEDDLVHFKLDVIAALGPAASATLTDPEYGAAQAIASGAIAGTRGLVVAVEATGYVDDAAGRVSRVVEGWSVEQAARLGADGVKLLVYYHPDADNAPQQEELVSIVAAECREYDLPLFLEPLSYALGDEPLTSTEFTDVVVETAHRLTPIGGDILKVEFPSRATNAEDWAEPLITLDRASALPWVILSGGVAFDVFETQASAAAAAGCCGVMVGRAVWKDAVTLANIRRGTFLRGEAVTRLTRLQSIAGPGWHDRAPTIPLPSPSWFR
jgi:tagatose 1,6-diphosphate aldolase